MLAITFSCFFFCFVLFLGGQWGSSGHFGEFSVVAGGRHELGSGLRSQKPAWCLWKRDLLPRLDLHTNEGDNMLHEKIDSKADVTPQTSIM